MLIGFFVVVNIVSIAVVVCYASQLHQPNVAESKTSPLIVYLKNPLLKMLKTSFDYKMCLLLPAFFYTGMECAFLFGQFTKVCINSHVATWRASTTLM